MWVTAGDRGNVWSARQSHTHTILQLLNLSHCKLPFHCCRQMTPIGSLATQIGLLDRLDLLFRSCAAGTDSYWALGLSILAMHCLWARQKIHLEPKNMLSTLQTSLSAHFWSKKKILTGLPTCEICCFLGKWRLMHIGSNTRRATLSNKRCKQYCMHIACTLHATRNANFWHCDITVEEFLGFSTILILGFCNTNLVWFFAN